MHSEARDAKLHWYENCTPKICNQTQMVLNCFSDILRWKKHLSVTAGAESWEPVGKAPEPGCIQLSLTSSQEQLGFSQRKQTLFSDCQSTDTMSKISNFSRVLNVRVNWKSSSPSREWSAKTSSKSQLWLALQTYNMHWGLRMGNVGDADQQWLLVTESIQWTLEEPTNYFSKLRQPEDKPVESTQSSL